MREESRGRSAPGWEAPPGDPFWCEAFRAWAEGISAGFLIFGLPEGGGPGDLYLEYANPAACAHDQRDLLAHRGESVDALFPGLRATELPELYCRVARGAPPVHLEDFVYLPRHEDQPHFELDVFPLPGGFVGVQFRNISERVEALQRAARADALVLSSHDAILSKTLEGIVTSWNPAAERLYGYRAEEMLGQSIARIVPEDLREPWEEIMARLRRGEAVGEYETERLHKDGRRVPVSLRISPILDALGRPVGASAIARDASVRRRLERFQARSQELKEENRRIQEANRVKSEFVANMSHDLRTPLNSILGFTKLLLGPRSPPLEESQRTYLGHVLTSAQDLLRLIDDILDLARVESGRLRFVPEAIELSELVGDTVGLVREQAAARRQRIEVRVAPDLGEVFLDPRRLKQVLYNYLSNAMKFSPEGGRIEVTARPAGEGAFRLAVRDEGVGIHAEDMHRLFREFQQLDHGPGKRYQGTGLGLAIVRRLVEAQGGEVGVQSTPGEGSEFWVTLPLRAAQDGEAETDSEAVRGASWRSELLLVEDDPDQQTWMAELLRAAGHRVRTVGTGREAVRLGYARRFSAVLLDLLLPDIDGWDVARALRASGPNQDTPVLIVSVVPEGPVVDAVRVDEFLSKPVDPEELSLALLRHGVKGRRRPVLLVDADAPERARLAEALRGAGFEVLPCADAEDACAAFTRENPTAVVLTLTAGAKGAPDLLARLRSLDGDHHRPVIVYAAGSLAPEDRERLLQGAHEVVPADGGGLEPLLAALRRHCRSCALPSSEDDAEAAE